MVFARATSSRESKLSLPFSETSCNISPKSSADSSPFLKASCNSSKLLYPARVAISCKAGPKPFANIERNASPSIFPEEKAFVRVSVTLVVCSDVPPNAKTALFKAFHVLLDQSKSLVAPANDCVPLIASSNPVGSPSNVSEKYFVTWSASSVLNFIALNTFLEFSIAS